MEWSEIDFEKNGKKCGQFKDGKESKMAYLPTITLTFTPIQTKET